MERSYREEANQQRVKLERKRHMTVMVIIYIGCALVTVGIFMLVVYGYVNRKYDTLETVVSTERTDSNTVEYIAYDNKLLKFSRDGASALDASGATLWNGSYDMSNPSADVCGKYAIIADIDGKEAYVYNGNDSGTLIETTQNIIQARVSKQGMAALLLEEKDSNVIGLYNPYELTDTLIAEIPTNVEDGFPVDFALSPDGTSIVAAYICVTDGIVESKLAFYNFSKVGQDRDSLVSGETYKDAVISKIEFIDDNSVCVFFDEGFEVWTSMKQPDKLGKQQFEEEICSSFYSDNHVGFIFENHTGEEKYTLKLYDLKGKEILNRDIDFDYEKVCMNGKEILLYSRQECMIIRMNGVEKLRCNFEQGVEAMFPAKKSGRYFLLEGNDIVEVRLMKQ